MSFQELKAYRKRERERETAREAAASPPIQATVPEWPDPDWSILDDRRGELPALPVDVLTPAWREWLERASHGAGVRLEHTAIPLLGIASSLIGCSRRVCASRSWSEPMTLWTCVVADSGDRKTPGLRAVVRTLDLIEKVNEPKVSEQRLKHETRIQRSKEVKNKWKENREAALKETPPKEPPPMPMDAIDPGNFIAPSVRNRSNNRATGTATPSAATGDAASPR
jgi:hypothetical protein